MLAGSLFLAKLNQASLWLSLEYNKTSDNRRTHQNCQITLKKNIRNKNLKRVDEKIYLEKTEFFRWCRTRSLDISTTMLHRDQLLHEKKNLKYIWWKRAQTDFKCWRIAPPRSWYIPMRACRRPSCRLHHKLWVPLTIMKLSWDWKSSISNLEHKCSGFQPVRAFPSRPVFRRLLSFPPCCV